MANNESSFKSEFRRALSAHYGERVLLWTNNDMFRCGLPDFSASYYGKFFGVESKFIKNPPVRDSSWALPHGLSDIQAGFLNRLQVTGNYGVVLVGLTDIAIAIPFHKWVTGDTNITLGKLKGFREFGFTKSKGKWDVANFFERIIECASQSARIF